MTHNFFKHEGLIDLLPQRQVLVMNVLLYLLPILDIGRRGIQRDAACPSSTGLKRARNQRYCRLVS